MAPRPRVLFMSRSHPSRSPSTTRSPFMATNTCYKPYPLIPSLMLFSFGKPMMLELTLVLYQECRWHAINQFYYSCSFSLSCSPMRVAWVNYKSGCDVKRGEILFAPPIKIFCTRLEKLEMYKNQQANNKINIVAHDPKAWEVLKAEANQGTFDL